MRAEFQADATGRAAVGERHATRRGPGGATVGDAGRTVAGGHPDAASPVAEGGGRSDCRPNGPGNGGDA